jgi:hypothetical protein
MAVFRQIIIDYFLLLQTSMMAKSGPKAVKEFTSSAYKQFGMRVVVLAAYLDTEGDPAMALWV